LLYFIKILLKFNHKTKNKDLKKRKIPILFFANKNDIVDGMSVADCSNALGLNNVKTKNWYIW